MRKYSIFIILILLIYANSFAAYCPSGNLYVDFDGGSDSSAGISTGTAWKHSPGDANAKQRANCTPIAGNVINFKKGVYYKGGISVNANGSSESPIVFEGQPSGWGTGDRAIIDPRISITMTVCPNAATCGGNANYKSMYYGDITRATKDERLMIFEGETELYFATSPTMSNPWYYAQVADMKKLPSGVTSTTITDAAVFTQADSNYWVGAWVVVWLSGNSLGYGKVTSFNPDTHTITFSSVGRPLRYEGNYYYSIFNNVALISQPGYYAIDSTNHKVYIWPNASASNISQGSSSYAFFSNSKNYHTIRNLKIIGVAVPLANGSGATDGVIFENNIVTSLEGFDASGAICISAGTTTPSYVRNNTISYVRGTRGIYVLGNGSKYIQNNTLSNINGTVIYSPGGSGVQVISGNTISDCSGTHANGISTYGSSSGGVCTNGSSLGVQVFNNNITNITGPAWTFECAQEILGYNNVLSSSSHSIAHWGNDSGDFPAGSYLRMFNNTMIGTNYLTHPHMFDEITMSGNIMRSHDCANSAEIGTHTYNIYYLAGGCPSLSTGEFESTDLTAIFTNPTTKDYTLKSGSPATDAFPTASAPTGTFGTDILGFPRPYGSAWDIGAYEYYVPSPPRNLKIK